jgi:hypothetical protein
MFTTCKSFHSLAATHMSAHRCTYIWLWHVPFVVSTVLSVQQNAPYIIWFAKFDYVITVRCNLQHTYELLNAGGIYKWFKETGNTWQPKSSGCHTDVRKECWMYKGHNIVLKGLYCLSQSLLWSQKLNPKYAEIVWNCVVMYFNWHVKSKTWSLQKMPNMHVWKVKLMKVKIF